MNYDAVLYLVAAEHPLALESFEHVLDDAALDLDLDETVAVDSVDVVERAYYYLFLILK